MEHVQAPIEGKTPSLTVVSKEDPAATAERDSIAEVAWPEDGLPIPRILMGPGTEATSNVETVFENDFRPHIGFKIVFK